MHNIGVPRVVSYLPFWVFEFFSGGIFRDSALRTLYRIHGTRPIDSKIFLGSPKGQQLLEKARKEIRAFATRFSESTVFFCAGSLLLYKLV